MRRRTAQEVLFHLLQRTANASSRHRLANRAVAVRVEVVQGALAQCSNFKYETERELSTDEEDTENEEDTEDEEDTRQQNDAVVGSTYGTVSASSVDVLSPSLSSMTPTRRSTRRPAALDDCASREWGDGGDHATVSQAIAGMQNNESGKHLAWRLATDTSSIVALRKIAISAVCLLLAGGYVFT